MAAEPGHAPNHVYFSQAGSLHANGGAMYSGTSTTEVQSYLAIGGTVTNSTTGVQSITTGLGSIVSAWANPISTAASTAAGVPDGCKVGFSTASGTLDILAYRQSATLADRIAATSSAVSIAWGAIGI